MASRADENVTYQQAQDLQRDLERVSVPIALRPHTQPTIRTAAQCSLVQLEWSARTRS